MKRIVLAGGSGFLGGALAAHFLRLDYEITILTRSPKPAREHIRYVRWDAATAGDWAADLDGAAAVINLTGRTVDCRYNARNRRAILDSRVHSTRAIGEAISRCANPPPFWLNASTATIYRHNFGPPCDEFGEIGATPAARDAFSVHVATEWERALADAPTPRTRKVALRSAMVLGLARNSVFPVLRRLARFGLGGKMGDGGQYVSWIHEVDFCRAVEWLINHRASDGQVAGPVSIVNFAAPETVTNAEMMSAFRELCGRRFGLPATRWMLEIGAFFLRTETELIIKSRRVTPRCLLESGFKFRYPKLREALADLQNRKAPA